MASGTWLKRLLWLFLAACSVSWSASGQLDCKRLAPGKSSRENYDAITRCLSTGTQEVTLEPGTFLLHRGIHMPPNSSLHGSTDSSSNESDAGQKPTTRLRLSARTAITDFVLRVGSLCEVSVLVLDAADHLVHDGCCSSVLSISGNDSMVSDVEVQNARAGVGVYFEEPTSARNVVRRAHVHDCYYGIVFVHGLPNGRRNTFEQGVVEQIGCDAVSFSGYGEVVTSKVRRSGFACGAPAFGAGAGFFCRGSAAGGLIAESEVYDTCGSCLDIDSCSSFNISMNAFKDPGQHSNNMHPHCRGSATAILLDSQNFLVSGNTMTNTRLSNRLRESAVGDLHRVFSELNSPAFSDLPGGANTILNFAVLHRPRLGALPSVGHIVEGNQFLCTCNGAQESAHALRFTLGKSSHSLTVGQVSRTFDTNVPASNLSGVVVFLHGFSGTKENMHAVADQYISTYNFAAVYPQGLRASFSLNDVRGNETGWNIGSGPYGARWDHDDVGFIKAIILEMQSALSVPPERFFVAGFGLGALMSYRLSCELTDLIHGFVGGGTTWDPKATWAKACHPEFKRPVWFFLGAGDTDNAESFNTWQEYSISILGCDASSLNMTYDRGGVNCTTFTVCPNVTGSGQARFCEYAHIGHEWPLGPPRPATPTAWHFLTQTAYAWSEGGGISARSVAKFAGGHNSSEIGVVVLVGDSVLADIGVENLLAQYLKTTVINNAVGGATIEDVYDRQAACSSYSQCRWSVIAAGMNSGGGRNIGDFVARELTAGKKVIIQGYPNPAPLAAFAPAVWTDMMDVYLQLAAGTENVWFVDTRDPLWSDLSHYAQDLSHPSAKGGSVFARDIASIILERSPTIRPHEAEPPITDDSIGSCLGLGYFASRGTGLDQAQMPGHSWGERSVRHPSRYLQNRRASSDVGSVRCGLNWYAADTPICRREALEPCNEDDFEHPVKNFRNNLSCTDYFAREGDALDWRFRVGRLRNPLPVRPKSPDHRQPSQHAAEPERGPPRSAGDVSARHEHATLREAEWVGELDSTAPANPVFTDMARYQSPR
eukprot:TRINITY_DN25847_c0_g2_i1.p1 TRINITY_DN25847_c0_g2~~TRINITY_DN25847_c0_g2_i1.p1  ORF type:complete len:1061 (-),score=98.66 TRINITY_DN25847_c0_g2_i1:224-3376(-)